MRRTSGVAAPPRSVVDRVLRRLRRVHRSDVFLDVHGTDPFRILIGCVLSLRTKDAVSFPASERLFSLADTPERMRRIPAAVLATTIYPTGFYRRKAEQIREISRHLLSRFGGRVPETIEDLLTLPGVGRKTANLVVTLGFGKPGICVDTHVHRITNRLGWVQTRTPDATEQRLREILPLRYWIPVNEILVRHGQQICGPISPRCSICPVTDSCPRFGVGRSR